MSLRSIIQYGAQGLLDTPPRLDLSVVTTAPAQTVTLQRITPTGQDVTLHWGDGTIETIADGNTGTKTHEYAAAGTYRSRINNPNVFTYFDLRDGALGCNTGEIGGLNLLTYLYLYNLPDLAVGLGEIGGLNLLTYLRLFNLPDLAVGLGEIGGLNLLTTLYLINLPDLTVGLGEIGGLNLLTTLYLYNLPNLSVGSDEFDTLTAMRNLTFKNTLSQTYVDNMLANIYGARASYTYSTPVMDISGTNSAPGGVYQDGDPPTTGLEYVYELANDPESEGFNTWTITYTGGSAP